MKNKEKVKKLLAIIKLQIAALEFDDFEDQQKIGYIIDLKNRAAKIEFKINPEEYRRNLN